MARGAGARQARRSPQGASGELMDSGRAAHSIPRGLAARRNSSREIAPPADEARAAWSSDKALIEILRGRLEGLGPVTPTALAAPLGLEPGATAAALAALESEGAILRGRFLPGVNDEQWCDRRLLARIHHYTVRRLRSEIEPVAARDFLRFLFSWQHVAEETRLEGPDALPVVLERARRLRGAGQSVGDRDPAGAAQGLSGVVARRANASPGGHPGPA